MRRCDPRTVSGLACWLDPTHVSLVSGKADVLTDLSGLGNHATASAAAQRPTPGTATNGQPCLLTGAAGVFSQMNFPNNAWSALTAAEMFVVMQLDADPPVTGNGGCWSIGNLAQSHQVIPNTDGTFYDHFGAGTRYHSAVTSGGAMTSPCIYRVSAGHNSWTNWLNETQLYTTASNNVTWTSASCLFCSLLAPSVVFMTGKFLELVLYDHQLPAGEAAVVKSYLRGKHKITA